MKHLLYGLSLISIIILASCNEPEEPKKKECTYVVLDWPEELARCITPEEERGLRDGTKRWDSVWKRLERECPNIDWYDNGATIFALAFYPDAIKVNGKVDMMNKLRERAQKDSCCIKKLVIRGHGNDGLIIVGSGRVKRVCKYINGDTAEIYYNPDDWKRDLADLKGLFCDSAELHLEGCNVGHDSIGEFKMQEIANEFGVTVSAPTTKIKANRTIGTLGRDSVRRVTPPPAGARERSNEKHRAEQMKDWIGRGADPFKKKVVAMGFYRADYDPLPDVTKSNVLPLTDPEWIYTFLAAIDTSKAYDANLELYAVDASVLIQYEDGTYQIGYTIYGSLMFGTKVDGLGDMQFSLSDKGTQMALEAIGKNEMPKR